jgi:hypothetical protein
MRPMRISHSSSQRLESDAEVLHFPEGGVFGRRIRPAARRHDAAAEVENALSIVQARMDALRQEVESALRFSPADTWPPRAA